MSPTDSRQPLSPAEAADRHAFLIGLAVLGVALKFAASAAMHFVDETARRWLDGVEIGAALFAVAVVAWIVLWKVRRLTPADRRAYFGEDSFVFDAFGRSRTASWSVTLVVLVAFELVAKRTELPAAFFVQAAVAAMLLSFSLKFLWLSREEAEEAGDDADV